MSEFATIGFDLHGQSIARLTLNRPERLNAYTTQMCDEIVVALERFLREDALRVLIVTGAGRAFCAGGDLTDTEDVQKGRDRQLRHAVVMREGMHAAMQALWACDKPVIAAINGPAVAGGLALCLACDFRIAGESARLGDPSGTAGLLPDEGGAWLFPRAMGLEAAMRMSLLGEIYDARTAHALGLVGEVTSDENLQTRSLALAHSLAERAPLAVRVTKDLMRRGLTGDFASSLRDAQMAVNLTNDSEDAIEGIAAFHDRRNPVFRGR
ncbi:enoyl-CoA hydratase/isomerase family protein [Nocardioides sp.]|uniref:enoyl-CoA hydratase/isomerase family protein n=1 Tax=Nocardioides sp. TaxID=35761 RepID=UPI002625B146|nr:enoyl-CoA hydratase/isomerase family protein [Nocardioides sp.]MDI6912326.1 enoyl-CoA hydratase/isomerase family protein [Nocardioides sp.]